MKDIKYYRDLKNKHEEELKEKLGEIALLIDYIKLSCDIITENSKEDCEIDAYSFTRTFYNEIEKAFKIFLNTFYYNLEEEEKRRKEACLVGRFLLDISYNDLEKTANEVFSNKENKEHIEARKNAKKLANENDRFRAWVLFTLSLSVDNIQKLKDYLSRVSYDVPLETIKTIDKEHKKTNEQLSGVV